MSDDFWAKKAGKPTGPRMKVQSSLWRTLSRAYPDSAQAGRVAWTLIKASQGDASALELLARSPDKDELLGAVRRTRSSPRADRAWLEFCDRIIAIVTQSSQPSPSPSLSASPSPPAQSGVAPMPPLSEAGKLAMKEMIARVRAEAAKAEETAAPLDEALDAAQVGEDAPSPAQEARFYALDAAQVGECKSDRCGK